MNVADRPLAAEGFSSYRYRGRYGFVMIGATSTADALGQARLSIGTEPHVGNLEVWDGAAYVPVQG